MIETVWVENPDGDRLEMGLRTSGDELGLVVFNLEGLGPPQATINGTGGPGFDGIRANSVRADMRQIILTLAVQGGTLDEESVRAMIYHYFPSKQVITFGINTSQDHKYIHAIVESNEMNEFAKVENAVLGLSCPQPWFIDVISKSISIDKDSVIPSFTYPFENPVNTGPELVYGFQKDGPVGYLSNVGHIESGCDIVMNFTGVVVNPTITNGDQSMTFDLSNVDGGVQAGDQLVINTRLGEKSVYFKRSGTSINMITSMDLFTDWIQVMPGINLIYVTAETGVDKIVTDISYHPLSEGI